jgi:hypothetical protein
MANDISARPWFIDTAGPLPIWQPQVYIKFIEVIGGAVAGAQGASMATIADRNNKPIIKPQFQTTLVGEIQTYNIENWFEGLIVSALGAGPVTLLVHVK